MPQFNTITHDLSLLGLGLQLVGQGDGKAIELDRCPKCLAPIAHYKEDDQWLKTEKYWHLGSKNAPCNNVGDL